MHSARRFVLAVLASVLAVATTAGPAGAGPDETSGSGPASGSTASVSPDAGRDRPGETVTTVTLITGDRVRVIKGDDGMAAVPSPGPGRGGVVFAIQRQGDALRVIPSDVTPLLAAGRLDPRLFDVAGLVEAGYDDVRRSTMPLILQHQKGRPVTAESAAGKPDGASIGRRLGSARSTVVREHKGAATRFWKWLTGHTVATAASKGKAGGNGAPRIGGALAENVRKVWLDGPVTASLDRSVPAVKAPQSWAKGYTGEGVTVAVLDTGIDSGHPDLDGAIVASKDFSGSGSTDDRLGHGTHVASIITGDGSASGGDYQGVAPDAVLLNGKVLDDEGNGTESSIIAGMEWAVDQGAKVVNLSLSGWPSDGLDPMSLALNRLSTSTRTLFVVAAGNTGPGRYTVTTPGTADEALTVAATDRDQRAAEYSAAGPRRGDYAMKPDIAAPGTGIVAARAGGTAIGEPVGPDYTALSGTSMAAPHVAGAAAILFDQKPAWSPRVIKANLMGAAALPVNQSVYYQGAGFLDISRALSQKVFALEGNVSAYLKWPHTEPATRTLTYRNPRSAPLTLDLAFSVKDQNGNRPAEGVLTLPESVTIQPYTTAKVKLTIDPAKSRPGLQYRGRITATAGNIVVRTPVSVTVEAEAYDITLDITDRNGEKVTGLYDGHFVDLPYLIDVANPGRRVDARALDGEIVVRAPRGAYTLALPVLTPDPEGGPASVTMMSVPRLTATQDRTLTLDAREAVPATADVEAADAETATVGLSVIQEAAGLLWGTGIQLTGAGAEAFVLPSEETSRPFEFTLFQGLSAGDTTYELAFSESGRLPADATYEVADGELADVSVRLAAHGIYAVGDFFHDAYVGSGDFAVAFGTTRQVRTPQTRRHLVAVEAGGDPVEWYSTLWANRPDGTWAYDEYVIDEPYEAGRDYRLRLSTAAFTPQGSATVYSDGWLEVLPEPFNSSGGGVIYPYTDTLDGEVVLRRDGDVIATSSGPFGLATDEAGGTGRYHVTMNARRIVPWSNYAAKVSGSWIFTATAPSSGGTALPFLAPRLTGDFDGWGRAPSGEPFQLTVHAKGAPDGLASAVVKVSYDDGETWANAPMEQVDGHWVATPVHPDRGADVSVRINVKDGKGNAATVTTIRAYRIAQLN